MRTTRAVSRGRRVEILARDTGRDTARSAALVRELAVSAGVRAVIGPVFSDIFSAASQSANALHLPIISPTATADRLAEIGPFIFQANPDNATRGRAAARYAVSELRMSSFAVMASDEPVGRSHAAAFVREAEALGATVYCTVFFPPDASDLREAFLSVRRAVMAEGTMIRRSDLRDPRFLAALEAFGVDSLLAADSLSAAGDSIPGPFVSVTTVFGPRGYAIAESLGLPIASPDTSAEETDIPMVTADGIFLALGDPGQLDYVAPAVELFQHPGADPREQRVERPRSPEGQPGIPGRRAFRFRLTLPRRGFRHDGFYSRVRGGERTETHEVHALRIRRHEPHPGTGALGGPDEG